MDVDELCDKAFRAAVKGKALFSPPILRFLHLIMEFTVDCVLPWIYEQFSLFLSQENDRCVFAYGSCVLTVH